MSNKNPFFPEAVSHYIAASVTRESAAAKALRDVTARHPKNNYQISPDQGAFLAMLVRLTGARRVLEVGTFTGYSALAMAEALPEGGMLVACDISAEYTAVGRPFWAQAGVLDRIDLRIAPALATLDALVNTDSGRFELVFIDADKPGYDNYYERALTLLMPGGIVVLDNMLWEGKVADPDVQDEETVVLRTLNAKIIADARIDPCFITAGDGLMVARKR